MSPSAPLQLGQCGLLGGGSAVAEFVRSRQRANGSENGKAIGGFSYLFCKLFSVTRNAGTSRAA